MPNNYSNKNPRLLWFTLKMNKSLLFNMSQLFKMFPLFNMFPLSNMFLLFKMSLQSILFLILIFNLNLSFATELQNQNINNFEDFKAILQLIKENYYEDVKDSKLYENALTGMTLKLDPYSTYLNKENYSDLKLNISGKFGGLGFYFEKRKDKIIVSQLIEDSPAEKAGLKEGDAIIRLNNASTENLSLIDAANIIRGKKGSKITLTLLRNENPKPFTITAIRDIIKIKSIRSQILDNDFGYINISEFQDDSATEFLQALKKLKNNVQGDLKGLIIDLRNNPGGVVASSVEIAESFLDASNLQHDGLIVYARGRSMGSDFNESARSYDHLNGAPLVVLVNEFSASASEIVAGALQDHGRAIIIGNNTFGKGTIQSVIPLNHEEAVKLTTARYYTPSGRSIQDQGIKPDIKIHPLYKPEIKSFPFFAKNKSLETTDDLQLNSALNILKGLAWLYEFKENTNLQYFSLEENPFAT